MTIQAALARSADLSKWIDSSIDGLDIPSGDREAIAAALFDQVHEHHKSIQLLLKSSLVGSAFPASFADSLRDLNAWSLALALCIGGGSQELYERQDR